jgi:hypothetical protein
LERAQIGRGIAAAFARAGFPAAIVDLDEWVLEFNAASRRPTRATVLSTNRVPKVHAFPRDCMKQNLQRGAGLW